MRRSDPTPVGDMLVSYEATAMPTDTLDRLIEEHIAEAEQAHKASEIRQIALVLGWLLRISLHKIRALEATR
jgi:uncharacterized membrane protein